MTAGEFAGWAWAIIGVVIGASLALLIVVSTVTEIVRRVAGKPRAPRTSVWRTRK